MYFIVSMVTLSIALSIGLISGFALMPSEITDGHFYLFVGKVAGAAILIIVLLIHLLKKTGHIRIQN